MNELSELQLSIILGLYYFDKNNTSADYVKKFTDKFNKFFNSDVNAQNINFALTNFKFADSQYSNNPEKSIYYGIWTRYINEKNIDILKKRYFDFKFDRLDLKKNAVEFRESNVEYMYDEKIKNIDYEEIDNKITYEINKNIKKYQFTYDKDKPKAKYDKKYKDGYVRVRDSDVLYNALKLAEFSCEYDKSHESFIRKNCEIKYTEGHHLIPLSFQDEFEENLDVEANIVSLCSQCHREIHYGKKYKEIVTELYYERNERLEKSGIVISLEKILKMYQ